MKPLLKLLLLSLCFLFVFASCDKPCILEDERCTMSPDPGLCQAAIPRYYYDADEGKCKEFTWGGCGEFPFETLTECEGKCSCED